MINSSVLVELFDTNVLEPTRWAVQALVDSIEERGFVVSESGLSNRTLHLVLECTDLFALEPKFQFAGIFSVNSATHSFCIQHQIGESTGAFKTKRPNDAMMFIEMLKEHLMNLSADLICEETYKSETSDISYREKYNSLNAETGDDSAQRVLMAMLVRYKRDGQYAFNEQDVVAGVNNPREVLTALQQSGFIKIGTGVRSTDINLDRTAADSIAGILGLA